MAATAEQQLARGAQRTVLDAFARALRREAHHLTEQPGILWQQMFNRVQWESEPTPHVLTPELARRSMPGAAPWMRLRTRARESSALIRSMVHQRIRDVDIQRIKSLAVSPDGGLCMSTSDEGTARFWDLLTWREMFSLRGDLAATCLGGKCAVSPDGSWCVIACTNGEITTIDISSRQVRHRLRAPHGVTRACAVSPDGTTFVTAADETITVWDGIRGESLTSSGHEVGVMQCCAFTPDGQTFVVGSNIGLYLIDVASWRLRTRLYLSLSGGVMACAVSADGKQIASAHENSCMRIWDAATGQQRYVLEHAPAYTRYFLQVRDCSFSPDGHFAASASVDGTVKIWDLTAGTEQSTLVGHTDVVVAARFFRHRESGATVLLTAGDGLINVWDPGATESGGIEEGGHKATINTCAISPTGAFFATGSADQTIKLWDTSSGTLLKTLPGHHNETIACAISPDGAFVISGGEDANGRDHHLKVWEVAAGRLVQMLENRYAPQDDVQACAVSPDATYLIVADGSRLLRRNAPGWMDTSTVGRHNSQINAWAIGPDAAWIAGASDDDVLMLWDALTGASLGSLPVERNWMIKACAIAPNGSALAGISYDRQYARSKLTIWSRDSRTVLLEHEGAQGKFTAVACLANGADVVAASEGGSLRMWNITAGRETARLPLPGDVRCVAAHPWLPLMVAGGAGGTFSIVELVGDVDQTPVLTAAERRDGLFITCPVCRRPIALARSELGTVVQCAHMGCSGRVRTNTFVVRISAPTMPESTSEPGGSPGAPKQGWWPFRRRR